MDVDKGSRGRGSWRRPSSRGNTRGFSSFRSKNNGAFGGRSGSGRASSTRGQTRGTWQRGNVAGQNFGGMSGQNTNWGNESRFGGSTGSSASAFPQTTTSNFDWNSQNAGAFGGESKKSWNESNWGKKKTRGAFKTSRGRGTARMDDISGGGAQGSSWNEQVGPDGGESFPQAKEGNEKRKQTYGGKKGRRGGKKWDDTRGRGTRGRGGGSGSSNFPTYSGADPQEQFGDQAQDFSGRSVEPWKRGNSQRNQSANEGETPFQARTNDTMASQEEVGSFAPSESFRGRNTRGRSSQRRPRGRQDRRGGNRGTTRGTRDTRGTRGRGTTDRGAVKGTRGGVRGRNMEGEPDMTSQDAQGRTEEDQTREEERGTQSTKGKLEYGKVTEFVGAMMSMCSQQEIEERIEYKNYGFCEVNPNTGEPDPAMMVKEYKRSAADKERPQPSEIRPISVLEGTLDYLMGSVLKREDVAFHEIYNFIRDRTRAIRTELTIQNERGVRAVRITERVARFHILADQYLCEEEMGKFDPRQNDEQLSNCLISLFEFYKDIELSSSLGKSIYTNRVCAAEEMIAYEIVFRTFQGRHADAVSQLLRKIATTAPSLIEESALYRKATDIVAAHSEGNYARFFKILEAASSENFLLACVGSRLSTLARIEGITHFLISLRSDQYTSIEELAAVFRFKDTEDVDAFLSTILEDSAVRLDERGVKNSTEVLSSFVERSNDTRSVERFRESHIIGTATDIHSLVMGNYEHFEGETDVSVRNLFASFAQPGGTAGGHAATKAYGSDPARKSRSEAMARVEVDKERMRQQLRDFAARNIQRVAKGYIVRKSNVVPTLRSLYESRMRLQDVHDKYEILLEEADGIGEGDVDALRTVHSVLLDVESWIRVEVEEINRSMRGCRVAGSGRQVAQGIAEWLTEGCESLLSHVHLVKHNVYKVKEAMAESESRRMRVEGTTAGTLGGAGILPTKSSRPRRSRFQVVQTATRGGRQGSDALKDEKGVSAFSAFPISNYSDRDAPEEPATAQRHSHVHTHERWMRQEVARKYARLWIGKSKASVEQRKLERRMDELEIERRLREFAARRANPPGGGRPGVGYVDREWLYRAVPGGTGRQETEVESKADAQQRLGEEYGPSSFLVDDLADPTSHFMIPMRPFESKRRKTGIETAGLGLGRGRGQGQGHATSTLIQETAPETGSQDEAYPETGASRSSLVLTADGLSLSPSLSRDSFDRKNAEFKEKATSEREQRADFGEYLSFHLHS